MSLLNSPYAAIGFFIISLALMLLYNFRDYKRSSYKGKIAFIEMFKVSIYDDFIKGFQSLSVEYKGEPVGSELIYAKGYLANIGNIDITSDIVDSPVELITFGGNKWEDVKINQNLTSAKAIIDNTSANISFDLIKQNEAIEIDILLKSSSKPVLLLEDIRHRIKDIEPGFVRVSYNQDNTKEVKSTYNAYLIIQGIVQALVAFFLIMFIIFSSVNTLIFTEKHSNKSYRASGREVSINDRITLTELKSEKIKKITLDSLNNRLLFTPRVIKINKPLNFYWFYYLEAILVPITIVTVLNYIIKYNFAKRISHIVNSKSIVTPS